MSTRLEGVTRVDIVGVELDTVSTLWMRRGMSEVNVNIGGVVLDTVSTLMGWCKSM